ncbi:3710_t:CDS:1, partial [Entrophospora sp. SA101]
QEHRKVRMRKGTTVKKSFKRKHHKVRMCNKVNPNIPLKDFTEMIKSG